MRLHLRWHISVFDQGFAFQHPLFPLFLRASNHKRPPPPPPFRAPFFFFFFFCLYRLSGYRQPRKHLIWNVLHHRRRLDLCLTISQEPRRRFIPISQFPKKRVPYAHSRERSKIQQQCVCTWTSLALPNVKETAQSPKLYSVFFPSPFPTLLGSLKTEDIKRADWPEIGPLKFGISSECPYIITLIQLKNSYLSSPKHICRLNIWFLIFKMNNYFKKKIKPA